jgi:hypothetical protein
MNRYFMNRFPGFIRIVAISAVLLATVVCGQDRARAVTVQEYRVFTAELYTQDKKLARIALRRFRMDRKEYYLAVDPDTLRTELAPVGKYLVLKKQLGDIIQKRVATTYVKARRYAEQNSRRLQNAGIKRITGNSLAAYLTADLCPTKLPMDRSLFIELVRKYGRFHRPVPVGLAVSGRWLEKHPDDLGWILGLEKKKDICVTWINHTYNHRYNKRVPWWRSFLLDKKNQISEEITQNEIAMIEAGLLPSVFFRFPGLVSNKEIFSRVTDYGLIPLGTDAWLGKKQWPVAGSIILVHANGQEPVGIKRFLTLLDSKRNEIAAGLWVLLDMREGISEMMKMY